MIRGEVELDVNLPLRLLPESLVELGLVSALDGSTEAIVGRPTGGGRATGTGGTEPSASVDLPRAA